MASPKIEYNIEDQYTVTQNNKVGAEDRGNVAVTGVSELTITTIPQTLGGNSCETLKEILAYADGAGNDVVTIDLDHTFEEIDIDIPDGITLQAEDGREVTVKLTNFAKARYNYNDITVGADSGTQKDDTPDQYSPMCCDSSNNFYYLKADGTFGVVARSAATGQTAVSFDKEDDYTIITTGTANQTDLIQRNTSIFTGITNTDTSNRPQLRRYTGSTGAEFYIQHTTNYILNKIASGALSTITIQDDSGGNFDGVQFWDCRKSHKIHISSGVTAGGLDVSYIYYNDNVYSTFQGTDLKYTIANERLIETDFLYINNEGRYFAGGTSIYSWDQDGGDQRKEISLNIRPDYSLFVSVKNLNNTLPQSSVVLFYIATDTNSSTTKIYRKEDNINNEWTVVKTITGRKLTPLTHDLDYFSTPTTLRITFKDLIDNKLYYFYDNLMNLSDSSINGLIVNDDTVFYDRSINNFGSIGSDDEGNSTISYCSIYGNLNNALYNLWKVNNSIIKSDQNGIFYKGSEAPTYSGECKNNLIIVDETGWRWDIEDGDTITTTAITFKNNTIDAPNGIIANSIDSSDTIKNNIIDAAAIGIGESSYNSSFTITNSVINGTIDEDITVGSTNEIAVNPLFKSITNEDYTLQSKAEGYPKDSEALVLGDDSKDAGCYDVTRTNTGESADSLTLEYIDTNDTTPPYQLPYRYEYPFKESSVTYQGNYIKNMDVRVGIITLDSQIGMDLEIQRELEYIQSLNVPLRFYPNGDTGIAFIIDKSGTTPDYSRDKSATLTLDFTAMTATVPSNFEFEINYLKGFWLEVDDGVGGDTYYYIDSNTKTVLSLVNRENETTPGDGSYTCKILWCYARMQDVIEYPSALSDDAAEQQIISTSKIELFMLDRKDI